MPSEHDVHVLKILGNRTNAKVITLLKRHPMSPRDLSRYLDKNEADLVRRLRVMEKAGLVESKWGTSLGKNVKLYDLVTKAIDINFQLNGIEIEFKKKNTPRTHIARVGLNLDEKRQSPEPLIGRRDELKLLSNVDTNFFWIAGVAGMGKSSLAEKFLQTMAAPYGSFWHTFKEIDTLTYLIGRIKAFLSTQGIHDLDDAIDAHHPTGVHDEAEDLDDVVDALNKIKCLLILDDFHKVKDGKIAVFLRILKQYSTNKVLVLSRSKPPFFLDGIQSKELVLQGLSFEDARQMISEMGLTVDDVSVTKVWRRFSGQPMSLKIFCLFAKQRNLSSSADFSTQNISTINDYFEKEIFEILSSDEQNILLTMSVFRTPVKSKAFKGISINQRNLGYMLHSLEKRMIINRTASDKFLVHDMLRDILYPMLAYPEDAHTSAALYYLSEGMAENVVEALYHLSKSQDKDRIFEILKEEVIEQKYRLIENGFAAPLIEILAQIDFQNTKKDDLAYFYNLKGKALSMLQNMSAAKENLGKAARLAKDMYDERILAYSLRNYGESLYLLGDLKAAEKSLLGAANAFNKIGRTQEALEGIYMILARLYFATGEPEESEKYLDLAKSISREEKE
jgi:DNA-binding transcriptional ArsR family regulator/tetratricopeptide (TPR) repeat protein